MSGASHRTSPDHEAQATCLLLVPRGFDAPADLLDGFRQRRVAIHEVADPPSVMVALSRRGYIAVVIVEPGAIADAPTLARALAHYHAALPIWRYRGSAEPRLARFDPAENGRTQTSPSSPPVVTNDPPPHAPHDLSAAGGNGAAVTERPATITGGGDRSAVEAELRAEEQLLAGRGSVAPISAQPRADARHAAPEPTNPPDADSPPLLADLTDEELAMLLAPDPYERGEDS